MKRSILDQCLAKELRCKDGAQLLQMHAKAFLRLKRRYLEQGESALLPKKPGPKKGSPVNKTPDWIGDLVVQLASQYRSYGPIDLADKLLEQHQIKLDQTTVYRILKRRQVRYYRDYPKIERKPPKLYCLDSPGQELQLDGCYPFGRSRPAVAFSAIDDCSRHVFGRCYDRETALNAINFVTKLITKVPFTVKAIRVDNRYGKVFKAYCENILGVEVIVNEPYSPQQNGKIERFNRTLKHQFFWRHCSFTDSLETLNYKYALWLNYYNYERKHSGYGMNRMTPAQKIASTLLFETSNTLIIYPQKVTGMLQQHSYWQKYMPVLL